MKMSLNQMITIVCILAVGFVTVAPFLQQETYAGVDEYECDAIEVYSLRTGKLVDVDIVSGTIVARNTNHTSYYHSGSCTALWDHYLTFPDGHGAWMFYNPVGKRWVA